MRAKLPHVRPMHTLFWLSFAYLGYTFVALPLAVLLAAAWARSQQASGFGYGPPSVTAEFTPSPGPYAFAPPIVSHVRFHVAPAARVGVDILDFDGNVVDVLGAPATISGEQDLIWNGRHTDGQLLHAGDYRFRVRTFTADGSGLVTRNRTARVRVSY